MAKTFANYGLQPITRIGKEKSYTLSDIIENRIENDRRINPKHDNLDSFKLKIEKLQEEVQRLRLKNAVLEGRTLPVEPIKKVMEILLSQTCDIIDRLPLAIAHKFPDLDSRIIDMFSEVAIGHQNECAKLGE